MCAHPNDVIQNEWKEAENNSKIVIAIFFDLRRAFETIRFGFIVTQIVSLLNSGYSGISIVLKVIYRTAHKSYIRFIQSQLLDYILHIVHP